MSSHRETRDAQHAKEGRRLVRCWRQMIELCERTKRSDDGCPPVKLVRD